MANYEDIFKKVVSHAKEYGYVFQSSEIYDGLEALYLRLWSVWGRVKK